MLPTNSLTIYQQACTVFQLLASRTWGDLEDGFRLGLNISEESVTDFLLLDLKKSLPNTIFVRKFTKSQEGKTTGADWEWWFVGRGLGFGMRVQAKRLSPKTQKYEDLGRLAGSSGSLQVDLLIADALKTNLYPAYCFYNYWDPTVKLPTWNCKTFPPNCRMFGCAVADALSIKTLISKKQNDLQSVANYCLPWSCLVCCEGLAAMPDSSLPDRVRRLVSQLLVRAEDTGLTDTARVPGVVEAEKLPHYVSDILESPLAETSERPDDRDIDGVLVVSID